MKFTTGLVRLSFAHIFQPAPDLNGNDKYSASLIIPKKSQTANRLKQAIADMLADPEIKKNLGKGNIRNPLRDGDEKDDEAYADSYFINAKSNPDHKPKVLDKDRQEVVDPSEVYSGCYVQAVVSLYPYNKGVNKGIGVSLLAIRKIKDGKAFTGSVVSDTDFDDSLLEGDDLDDLM